MEIESAVAFHKIEYKYGIYDDRAKAVILWESGQNRYCQFVAKSNQLVIRSEHKLRLPAGDWKGTGEVFLVIFLNLLRTRFSRIFSSH